MEVIKIKENKDGSATVTLEFSKKEEQMLIEYAVNNLMKEYIEAQEKRDEKKNCWNCERYECMGCNNNDRWIPKGEK